MTQFYPFNFYNGFVYFSYLKWTSVFFQPYLQIFLDNKMCHSFICLGYEDGRRTFQNWGQNIQE